MPRRNRNDDALVTAAEPVRVESSPFAEAPASALADRPFAPPAQESAQPQQAVPESFSFGDIPLTAEAAAARGSRPPSARAGTRSTPSATPTAPDVPMGGGPRSFSFGSVPLTAPGSAPIVQPSLRINTPGDRYEQEADAVAEQVMRAPAEGAPAAPATTAVDSGGAGIATTPQVEQQIGQLRGGGSPLPTGDRSFFEERMGADFSQVRIHTGDQAASTARQINARAFTVGADIAFDHGEYTPGTSAGRELLAHELTHVTQQLGGAVARKVQRAPSEDDETSTAPEAKEPATPSIEEAVATAVATVTPDEVAAAPIEGVSVQPVGLAEAQIADKGGAGGGAGGGGAEAAGADKQDAKKDAKADQAAPAAKDMSAAPGDAAPSEGAAGAADAPAGAAPTEGAAPTGADAKAADPAAAAAKDAAADPNAKDAAADPNAKDAEAKTADPAAPAADPNAKDAEVKATDPAAKDAEAKAADPAAKDTAAVDPNVKDAEAKAADPAATPHAAAETAGAATEDEEHAKRRQAQPGAGPRIQRALARPHTPSADPAFQAVAAGVKATAQTQKQHAPAAKKASETQAAAKMPQAERMGAAQHTQATTLTQTAAAQEAQAQGGHAPGFDQAAFVAAVKSKITALTPKDPKQMESIGSSGVFDQVQGGIAPQVASGKDQAKGQVDDQAEAAPNTAAVPEKAVTALPGNKPGATPKGPDAKGAAPKPADPAAVEAPIQAESAALDTQMTQAQITPEQLQKSNEPTFTAALDTKTQAQTESAAALPAYRAKEQAGIGAAQGQAASLTAGGVGALGAQRTALFGQVDGLQRTGTGENEEARAKIGAVINGIYEQTRTEVEGILSGLDSQVDQAFSAGAGKAKQAAVDWINQQTKAYKDKRYNNDAAWYDVGAHLEGAATWVGDELTGMPDEYYTYFNEGRDRYLAEMDTVLAQVAGIVGTQLGKAHAAVERGRQRIADEVAKQPAELRKLAQEVAGEAQGKFDSLEQSIDAKQQELVDHLAQQYTEQVQALDSELDAMKAASKGLLAKAGDMIGGVIKTIQELRAMLEGVLRNGAAAIGAILQDPIGFLGNLLSAVGQGLHQFGANIGTHLQAGLISWLTGTLSASGIQLPKAFDLAGIFNMVLQILGLTYPQVRGQVVKSLGPNGEEIVGALEKGWEIFQIIRTEGLAGLWAYIQDQVGDLKAMVIDQIKDMVISQVIKAGIEWLVGILGGPAGAFVKAVQGIIRVVTWFANNAARLASLMNSIFSSISAIAAGNIGGAANFIEQSLATALPTVISFLADLLGLGGISKKVQGIIEKVQAPIKKAIDWVVQKAVAMGKKLWAMIKGIGKGKGGKGKDGKQDVDDSDEGRQARLSGAVNDANQLMHAPDATVEDVRDQLPPIKERYDLTAIDLVKDDKHSYHVLAKINPQLPGAQGKLWTEAEEKEMQAAAQDIANKINENEAKKPGEKQRFKDDPIGFLSNKKTPKGKDNHYRGQLGPAVEGAAAPSLEVLAQEANLTLLRNVGLQCVDAGNNPIGALRTELDFLLLGSSDVVEIISAKLDTTKVSPKTDRAALAHFQNIPLSPPEDILNYIKTNPQAFGNASGYRDVAAVHVVSQNHPSMTLSAFRSQYLSKTVVSDVNVKGVGPEDSVDRGYTLRFTEAEIVAKVAELIAKLL